MTGGLGVFLCFVLLSLYGVYSVGFVYIWGGVGWGGDVNVLTTTSSILRCQHRCSLEVATCNYVETTLGWGGDVNVLTTTSSILRCQHRCSLEVATCNYVETTLGWGGGGIW